MRWKSSGVFDDSRGPAYTARMKHVTATEGPSYEGLIRFGQADQADEWTWEWQEEFFMPVPGPREDDMEKRCPESGQPSELRSGGD
jgi:hypothetical protein